MINRRTILKGRFIFVVALLVATFASPITASVSNALGTPSILSYQGRLADASGNLLGGSGTNYYFTFSIWDNPTVGSGNRLWPTSAPATTTLPVRQGVFNVNIGDTGAGYPDTLDYNFNSAKDIYLQIQVSSDNVTFQTLSPRQRISAAAFARLAGAVSGADTPSSFGTTTPNVGAQVTIEATTTSSIALSIRARLSQVANLLEIKNSVGTNLFTVDSLGGIFTNSTLAVTGATSASSTLAVTGATTLYGGLNLVSDVTPTTDIARSLGTNSSRFLNLFSQNIYASSSVITTASTTNLSSTGFTGQNGIFTGTFDVVGKSTFANASTTQISASTGAFLAALYVSGNASTTALSASTFSSGNTGINGTLDVTGKITGTTASTTQISASTGATIGALSVTGTSDLANTVNASSTLNVTGQSRFYAALNVLADILPTTDIARSLGTNALRFLNTYTQNLYASSSVITNASTTGVTATRIDTNIINASTSVLTNASTTGITATRIDTNILNASSALLTLASTSQISASVGATLAALNVTGNASTTALSATTLSSGNTGINGTLNTTGAVSASSTLAVTGQSYFYAALNLLADILPTTDISRSIGSNSLRFLNLFSQNIYASSSVITNASTTGVTATNIFTTNLYASTSVLTNASTTGITVNRLFGTSIYASSSVLTNASTTGITATRIDTSIINASTSVLTLASTTGITATRIDTNILNASSALLTNASTTGVTATNIFSTNIFASSSLSTNASSTGLTLGTGSGAAGRLYFANASNGFTTQLISSSTQSADLTFTLPGNLGTAGQVLTADGTGGMYFKTSTSGGGHTIMDEGGGLTTRTNLNFVGTGVSCADNSGNDSTDCTINSGGSLALNSIASATGNATTSNTNYQQVWDWATTDTGNAFSLTGGALSTGSLLSITSSSSALTGNGELVNIMYTGNATNGTGSILNVGNASSTNIFNVGANGSVNLGTTAGSALLNINTTSATFTIKNTTAGFSVVGSVASSSVATSSDAITLTYATTSLSTALGNGVITANSNTPTGSIQAGAVAVQRADGKYLIAVGGNGVTSTELYDPVANSFTVGPVLTTASGGRAGSAFRLPNGKFLILPHRGTGSNLYDPLNNTIAAGATLNSSSSAAMMRTDGQIVIFTSNTSTVTNLYNPSTNASANGAVTASNQGIITTNPAPVILQSSTALATSTLVIMGSTNTTNVYNTLTGTFAVGPTLTANVGLGLNAFQRQDGKFVIVLGGNAATTNIYDPVTNLLTAGPNLSGNAGAGSHSIQRPDGTFLVVHGNSLTTTSIYDPVSNVFNAGPSLGGTAAGEGAFSIMRPDGKIVIFLGGNSTANVIYDTSWAFTGTWISEDMNLPKISFNSVFNAKSNNEGIIQYYIKTGQDQSQLATNPWIAIRDKDRVTASSTDAWIKIKVVMTRSTPTDYVPIIQPTYITNTMKGTGDTRNFQILPIPTVYSLTIDNSSVIRRDNSDFGIGLNAEDASGPVAQNVRNGDLGLTLNYRMDYLDGTAAVNNDLGIFPTTGPMLGAGVGGTSFAMKLADGNILFVHSAITNSTTLYNPITNSTSTGPTLTANAGNGSKAVRLPNGNFFAILGNGTAVTNIYSATSSTFTAGPTLSGNVASSSKMIINPDGTVLVIHGGTLTTTSLCNLTTGIMRCIAGPATTAAVGRGSQAIQRPDGKWFIVLGNRSTTTNYYDPMTKIFTAGPALSSAAGEGSQAIQRGDGKWVIIVGETASAGGIISNLYDPTISIGSPATLPVAAVPTTGVGMGAVTMQRADGRMQTIVGSSTGATIIYNENGGAVNTWIGAFIAGAVMPSAINNVGTIAVQLNDGRYMIVGNSTTTPNYNATFFDAGWIMNGYYQSEVLSTPNLTSESVLDWTGNADAYKSGIVAAYVRSATSTGALQTAQWRMLPRPGAAINPASGDIYMQVKFTMNRPMAEMPNNERYVYYSDGYAVYNRLLLTPTLETGGYSITNQADVFVKPVITSYKVYDSTKPDIAIYSLNGNNLFRFSSDGSAYTSNGSWNAGGADVAEYFPTDDATLEPGDIVSVADNNGGLVKKTTEEYDQNLLGIVTTAPGVRLGVDITGGTADKQPIALAGRVPVKVSLENGPIKKGDRITSSTVAGVGMKAIAEGRVVAIALEDFIPDADGRGAVLAFVGAQEYMGVTFYEKTTNGLSKWANLIAFNLNQLNIFTKDGNVGLGVTSPSARLHVDTNIRVGTENNNGCIENGAGAVISGTCISDSTQFSSSTEVVDVLAQLKGLKMVAFNWSEDTATKLHKSTSTTEYTIIASSTELTLPGLFSTSTDGLSIMDYSRLAFYGIVAVQELNNKVDALTDASSSMKIINKDGIEEDTFVGKFFKRLTLWLSDSTNGIKLVVAKAFKSESVDTGMVCMSSGKEKTCITKKELDELLLSNKITPSKDILTVSSSTAGEVLGESTSTEPTTEPTENVSNELYDASSTPPVVSDTPGAVVLDESGVVSPISSESIIVNEVESNSTDSIPASIDEPVINADTSAVVNEPNVSTTDDPIPSF